MKAKSFLFSWTLWVNAILVFAGWFHDHGGALIAQLPDAPFHTWLNYAFGAANFILRFKTIGPIALSFAKNAGKWGTPALLLLALGLGARANASGNEHFFRVPVKLTVRQDVEMFPRPKVMEAFLVTRDLAIAARFAARRQALSTANIEYAFLYDFKHRESIPVASYKISEIDGFAGKFQLEIWGYAGMNVTTQQAAAGAAVVVPWKAAKNLTLYLGVAGISEAGSKLNLLPIVGINFAPK